MFQSLNTEHFHPKPFFIHNQSILVIFINKLKQLSILILLHDKPIILRQNK